ncbi:GDP/GTP exchange factor for ARF [Dinochytrium kinnereticum]|nr:GDP/GTP exchange factor for ARF [Dinochytrium kinnereticum]
MSVDRDAAPPAYVGPQLHGVSPDPALLRPSKPQLRWAFVIHSEIVSVTSAMRKNARWSIADTYGSSMENMATSPRGSMDKARIPGNVPLGYDYNYCLDVVERNFSAAAIGRDAISSSPAIDAVLEFTAVRAGAAEKSHAGLAGRASVNGMEAPAGFTENPLLQGFTQLKARLTLIEDIKDLDPMQVLSPFLDVIRSGDTTGPITGAALTSIEKFIKYEVLDPNHPGMPAAMSALTYSVTRCKFEATDAVSDEVVLSKILRLIRIVVKSEVGQRNLDDKGICEMVETGFGMCFQGRVSELLRRSAEQTLVALVQSLFERLTAVMNFYKPTKGARPITRNHSHSTIQPLHTHEEPPPVITVAPSASSNTIGDTATVITVGIDNQTDDGGALTAGVSPMDDSHHGIHIQVASNEGIVVDHTLRPKRSQSFSKAVQLDDEEADKKPVTSAKEEKKGKSPKSPPVNEDAGNHHLEDSLSSRYILPFGLPAILELLRVLVTLIDPRNRNHTDTMHRMVALGLLSVAIEVGGESLGEWVGWGRNVEIQRKMKKATDGLSASADDESEEDKMAVAARDLVVNELTKYLFQLLQSSSITVNSPPSTATLTLFSLTLRVVTSLFQTARLHLKLQLEWLLEWIMARVNAGVVSWDVEEYSLNGNPSQVASGTERDPPSKLLHRDSMSSMSSQASMMNSSSKEIIVPEVRELLLETFVQFFKNPSFAAELWVNYDGDMGVQGHLLEEVIRFLSKHSFPDATPGGPAASVLHQTLCLDSILLFLKNIINHSKEGSKPVDFPFTAEDVLNTKHRKRILREGAERFNTKPSDGITFLQANGFLPDPVDPASLASFLKSTPRVNKKLLGEYIAKPSNIDLLKAFIQLYDFKGKRLDEGLRLLLESFRLPGEAQQIDRILECFASAYFASTQNTSHHEIADESSTFVLAFSIILLNTDQHNPQVRRRMTKEDFKRNTRGCNNKEDFDPEYLGKIYDAIKETEIVMPEEQEGDLGFSYTWRELLKRSEVAGLVKIYNGPAFDKDMFLAVWTPTLAAISYAFDNAEDSLTLQKAIVGFHSCATIASRFNLFDVLDSIIVSLSKITGLLKDNGPLPEDTDTRPDEGGARVPQPVRKVDRWSVEFGRSYRGQVAAVLMFNLAIEYGNVLREGWKNVVTIIGNLFLHSLLPIGLLTADDFVQRSVKIPRLIDVPPKERNSVTNSSRREGAGLFSTLSHFLSLSSSSANDEIEEYEPTAEELDAERFTVECITSCRIEELFADSRFMQEDALRFLMSTLFNAFTVTPHSRPLVGHALIPPRTSSDPNAKSPVLESQSTKYSAAAVFYLELLVRIALQNRDRMSIVWPLALEYIKTVLADPLAKPPALLDRAVDEMVSRVFESLDLLSNLPPEAFNIVAEQVMAGILSLVKLDQTIISRHSRWTSVLHLLSATATHPEAIKSGFEIACILVNENSDSMVSVENFGECVDLFIGFASAAGSIIASAERAAAQGGETNGRLIGSDHSIERNPSRNGSPKTPRRSLVTGKGGTANYAVEIAVKSMEKLFKLQFKIPRLIQQTGIRQERVRQHALTLLQRALLSAELESGTFGVPGFEITSSTMETWVDCFENVIFPLLDELLKPEVYKLDPTGMDETRMRASALLCKIFLQYLQRMSKYKDLPRLWVHILNYMKRYMQSSRQEFLNEGILESLKNMLLVMSTQGVFSPGEQSANLKSQHNLWDITWVHLHDFLPGLKDELFPPHFETEEEAIEPPAHTTKAVETLEEVTEKAGETAAV